MSEKSRASSRSRREKLVESGKLIGSLVMYIGSAAMASCAVRKVRENCNPLMGVCAIGTGAMLSVGMGRVSTRILNQVIDKTAAFVDNVKPPKETKKDAGLTVEEVREPKVEGL